MAVRLSGPLTPLGLAVALAVFVADQALKFWLLGIVDIARSGPIRLAPFLDIVLVWNTGISYGLFQQQDDTGRWLLVALSLAAIGALLAWLAAVASRLPAIALALVIGGAAGNLLDRAIHGAVADFVLLHAYGYHWYVFNLADAAIVAGVVLLLYDSLFRGHKSAPNDG